MALAVTSAGADLVSVSDVRRHLGLLSTDHDDELASVLRAAIDACERGWNRTFRGATTRTFKTDRWWAGTWCPPFPPLLGITSVTYYDADNASQTLAASNYHVVISADWGEVAWATGATLPAVYDRPDAITVTFTTGYASLETTPPVAVQAIKTKVDELWGAGTENEQKAAMECTKRLLRDIDATSYV